MKDTFEAIKTELQGMWEDLKTIVNEAIDEKVEASGGINTALLDKRLDVMDKGLTEKMDTLDYLQLVKSLKLVPFCPDLVDLSEEPVVATCNHFLLWLVLVCARVFLFTTGD